MSDDIPINVVQLTDRDQQIFQLRLMGESVGNIARQFRLAPEQVVAIVSAQCTSISEQFRKHTLELELERLDDLERPYYPKAREGNHQSLAACLKIAELRADYLGIRAPVRVDPVQLVAMAAPQKTSTDKIEEALARISGKPLPPIDADPEWGGKPTNGNGSDEEPPSSSSAT
jgi:hypothetical protein